MARPTAIRSDCCMQLYPFGLPDVSRIPISDRLSQIPQIRLIAGDQKAEPPDLLRDFRFVVPRKVERCQFSNSDGVAKPMPATLSVSKCILTSTFCSSQTRHKRGIDRGHLTPSHSNIILKEHFSCLYRRPYPTLIGNTLNFHPCGWNNVCTNLSNSHLSYSQFSIGYF